VDASVVVKWCAPTGEPRAAEAGFLLEAHLEGRITAAVLDLTFYEVGNALTAKGFTGPDLEELLGLLWVWELEWIRVAGDQSATTSSLVEGYELSFYDASYLAAAGSEGLPLVTDDRALLLAAQGEEVGIDLAAITG
jgi:predicted nucleic acid-binding protein